MGILSYIKSLPSRFKNCFKSNEELVSAIVHQSDLIEALENALADSNNYIKESERNSTNRLALLLMKMGGTVTISEEIQAVIYSTPEIFIDIVPIGNEVQMTLTLSDGENNKEDVK